MHLSDADIVDLIMLGYSCPRYDRSYTLMSLKKKRPL